MSVLSQPYVYIEQYINESWAIRNGNQTIDKTSMDLLWSLINVLYPVSTILGQLISALICEKIGRKYTAVLSCALGIPGLLLSFFSKICFPYFELLIIGRFIWSVAIGLNMVNQTVWLVEVAPLKHRGKAASMQEIFNALGGSFNLSFVRNFI